MQRELVAVADHGDVALMEGMERRAVADRDDGGLRQFRSQQIVKCGFRGFVERRRGLVEEQILRRVYSARASPRRCCSPRESIRFQCASSCSRSASLGRPTRMSASRTWSVLKVLVSPG